MAPTLYQNVITQEERKRLGEYYTPRWLAREITEAVVDNPLKQRVLDPSCGSGTFIETAIEHILAHSGDSKERTFESTFVIVVPKPRRKPKAGAPQSRKASSPTPTANIGKLKPAKTSGNCKTTTSQAGDPKDKIFELVAQVPDQAKKSRYAAKAPGSPTPQQHGTADSAGPTGQWRRKQGIVKRGRRADPVANAAWLAVQVMAHNLARWTARIGLGEQVVTTKTLRRRLFSIAGRLTLSARRLTLHLLQRWPWETQFSRALARLRALPFPA